MADLLLGDLARIELDYPDADFWIDVGGREIGRPIEEYAPDAIGVKVMRTDILLPKYLYYWFMNQWMQGVWRSGPPPTPELIRNFPLQAR